MTNLKRKFNQKLGTKQEVLQVLPAVIGDGSGNVYDDDGRIFVRVGGRLQVVKNSNVFPLNDLPVWVGYEASDPKIFKILNGRVVSGSEAGNVGAGGSRHANTHELFGSGIDGGSDVVKVQLGQFMPLRVLPYDGMIVIIWPGIVKLSTGYILISDINGYGKPIPISLDLEDYALIAESGKAYYLLITIDNAGVIILTPGSQVDISALVLTDIPAEPVGTLYVLAAVKIYFNQMEVRVNREATDIVDLRFPMDHKHPATDISGIVWDDIDFTVSDLADLTTKSHTSLSDIGTNTHGDIDLFMSGHTHEESEITDLSHNAVSIGGIAVDLTGIADTNALVYNSTANKIVAGEAVGGGGGGGTSAGDGFWHIDGLLAIQAGVGFSYVVPRACTISFVFIHCKTTGSADNTIIDIHLNGVTIFTTQGNRPSLAYNDADKVAKSGVPDIVDLVEGDVLTCDIDAIAVGSEGLSVVVGMVIDGSGTDGAAIHDNVGNEINFIAEKTSIAADDMFIIEDSADSNNKKMVKASNLVSGGFYGDILLRTVVAAGGQANFDIASIPSGYDVIKIFLQGKTERTDLFSDNVLISLNADTTNANYYREQLNGVDVAASATEAEDRFIGYIGSSQDAMNVGQIELSIIHPSSPFHKTLISETTLRRAAAMTYVSKVGIAWENTAAITRITLTPSTANDFAAGTLCLIVGYKDH